MVKRLLLGTLVLFFWLIAGLTVALPFILTLSVGLGLLPPHGFPFPYRPFQTLLAVSLPLSLLTGLWWYGFPQWWIGGAMEGIRLHLETHAPRLKQKALGMLVLLQLCAFLISPLTALWWGLYHLLRPAMEWHLPIGVRFALFAAGFLWLALILGRPHLRLRQIPFLGNVIRRCQMTLIDWWMRFDDPLLAEEERQRLLGPAPQV